MPYARSSLMSIGGRQSLHGGDVFEADLGGTTLRLFTPLIRVALQQCQESKRGVAGVPPPLRFEVPARS